jgi:hypothetical protein
LVGVSVLVGLLAIGGIVVVVNQIHDEKPGVVPPDLCALIPADLLARIVPSAQVSNRQSSPWSASCNEVSAAGSSGPDQAQAAGSLSLFVDWYSSTLTGTAVRRARAAFGSVKQEALDGGSVTGDLAGLGDSAYLTKFTVAQTPGSEWTAGATVDVLRGDAVLSVFYFADPTTQARADATAVDVARALIGRLP